MFKQLISNLFLNNKNNYLLGRWCHKSLPNCGEKIINKKIDFALYDNDIGNTSFYKSNKSNKRRRNKSNKFTYEDYISYYYNI